MQQRKSWFKALGDINDPESWFKALGDINDPERERQYTEMQQRKSWGC